MSYQSPRIEFVKSNVLRVYHPDPLNIQTNLTTSLVAGNTALTVQNNQGFIQNDVLLFEGFGIENAEIKSVSAAVTLGTSITSTAVTFAHAIDCPIYKLLFDQIEIRGGTTAATAASATGTIVQFNSSNTTPLNVTEKYTDFVVTGTTFDYYGARFYNSLAAAPYYSAYMSEGIAATDFTVNTIGFVRRNAFKNIGEIFGPPKWNADWVFDQIYLGELDVLRELKRWSWLYTFDSNLGNITTGNRSIALPSNIEDPRTNKSILGLRIENNINLDYIDWTEYKTLMQNVFYTTLASTAAIGATTMVLTDSRDFDDSGSITIQSTTYSYTGNTRSTNTLTGFTALTAQVTAGAEVWQGISFGTPERYAVNNGNAYFDVPPSSDSSGRHVWCDFYATVARHSSDGELITMPDAQLLISWLEMAIKKEKQNGSLSPNDISFIEYNRRKQLLKYQELSGQRIRMVPEVPVGRRPLFWR